MGAPADGGTSSTGSGRGGQAASIAGLVGFLVIQGFDATPLERDDLFQLDRLHSGAEWLRLFREEPLHALAYQPLREALFAWDLGWGARIFGDASAWVTQGVVGAAWIAAAAFWLRASKAGTRESRAWAIALVCVHPVFVCSLAWISARKHLLAVALVLAASGCLERALRDARGSRRVADAGGAAALWLASLFAHPIGALWPLWAMARAWSALPPRRRLPVALGTLGAAVVPGLALLHYYAREFPGHAGVAKFVAAGWGEQAGAAVLAWGRATGSLILGWPLPTLMGPASPWGVVGLALLVALAAAFALRSRRGGWGDGTAGWALALGALPLALVTARMTHVFLSFSYLLLPLAAGIGTVAARGIELGLARPELRARTRAVAATLLAIWAALAWAPARAHRSDSSLWEYSARVEPEVARSWEQAGLWRLQAGRWEEALAAFAEAAARAGGEPSDFLRLGLARVWVERPGDPPGLSERRAALEALRLPPAWLAYFSGLLHARAGDRVVARAEFERALEDPEPLGDAAYGVVLDAAALAGPGEASLAARSRLRDSLARRLGPRWRERAWVRTLRRAGAPPDPNPSAGEAGSG